MQIVGYSIYWFIGKDKTTFLVTKVMGHLRPKNPLIPAWLIAPGSRQAQSHPRAADNPSSARRESPDLARLAPASVLLSFLVLVLSTS
jgi:hypothetical protein